jgi:regulator of replication initiation timing
MAKQQIVKSLSERVAKVIEENNRLERQQAEMMADLQKLRVENRALKEKLDETQKKLSLLELGEGLASKKADSASRKRARAQINRLMREIDRCIALMNQ